MLVLETARLALRRLSSEDAPFMLELLNDPAFLQHIGDRGVRTLEDARRYIENGPMASYERFGFGLYCMELKGTQVPVGICGLLKRETLQDVDVGFALLPRYRAKGYAREAVEGVLAYGRESLGLKRIVAITSPGNAASISLLAKFGFRFEGMTRLSKDGEELKLFACGQPCPDDVAKGFSPARGSTCT
jgi:RimJ/RimL family protein N-acetyltransferase